MTAIGQLRWQCRRGVKELDILLSRYLDQAFATASSAERSEFTQLLALQDPELAAYLLAGDQPDSSGQQQLVRRIRTLAAVP